MAKIAFIVPPLTGHYNPTLSVGAGLIAKGHEVSWIALDHDNIDKCLPEGGIFLPIPLVVREENKKSHDLVRDTLQSGSVHGIESVKYLYEHAMTPFNNYMFDKIMKALDEYPMDLLIIDQHLLAGAVAAVLHKIPYVTSVSSPATVVKSSELLPQFSQLEAEHVLSFQQQCGIPGTDRYDVSTLMSLVYTSKLFFGDYEVPDYYKFIGPVINPSRDKIDFDWDRYNRMPDRPKLFVSVGTTFSPEANRQFFNKVIEAFEGENFTVVVASEKNNFKQIPDNFVVQRRVPQLKLLPQMDVVICHGGFNTVNEAIFNLKPLIILPKAYDQSYVSSKVVESGTGMRLNFNRFKPGSLREAVDQILSDNSYLRNVERIKQSFVESGGISKGVELLESLL